MDKKYQIFISSTYRDLIPERNKVRDTILSMYQFPIGMEMFSAANEDQWEIIKETIDSSDYYVLIIGKRYGTMIEDGPEKGISYTEKEYQYAKSIGVPILAYIKKESVITADNADEDPEKLKKLKAFISDVTTGREVKWFESVDQLANEVTLSLHKEMGRKKRPGWIRADSVDIEKSLSEIVELSKQNRKLQEEKADLLTKLDKLNSSADRKPLLTVTIAPSSADQNEKHPELFQRGNLLKVDEDKTVSLILKSVSTNLKEAEYYSVSRNDFPPILESYISDDEIQKYNDSLPAKDILQDYLCRYKVFLQLKETGVPVTFFVENLGTAKATDISIKIEFPEQIRVFDIKEIIDLEEPTAPQKPENLIQKAYERANAAETAFTKMFSNLKFDNLAEPIIDYSLITDSMEVIGNGGLFELIEIIDNTVEIEQRKGIVHTKDDWFRGAYIVPMAVGTYEAKVTIMCAEYEKPEEMSIKFKVIESIENRRHNRGNSN